MSIDIDYEIFKISTKQFGQIYQLDYQLQFENEFNDDVQEELQNKILNDLQPILKGNLNNNQLDWRRILSDKYQIFKRKHFIDNYDVQFRFFINRLKNLEITDDQNKLFNYDSDKNIITKKFAIKQLMNQDVGNFVIVENEENKKVQNEYVYNSDEEDQDPIKSFQKESMPLILNLDKFYSQIMDENDIYEVKLYDFQINTINQEELKLEFKEYESFHSSLYKIVESFNMNDKIERKKYIELGQQLSGYEEFKDYQSSVNKEFKEQLIKQQDKLYRIYIFKQNVLTSSNPFDINFKIIDQRDIIDQPYINYGTQKTLIEDITDIGKVRNEYLYECLDLVFNDKNQLANVINGKKLDQNNVKLINFQLKKYGSFNFGKFLSNEKEELNSKSNQKMANAKSKKPSKNKTISKSKLTDNNNIKPKLQHYQNLVNAIKENNLAKVKECIEDGSDPSQVYQNEGTWGAYETETCMSQIFSNKEQDKTLIKYLIEYGGDVNSVKGSRNWKGSGNDTQLFTQALEKCLKNDDEELLEIFIKNGADPNQFEQRSISSMRTDGGGKTYCIHKLADSNNSYKFMKVLLENGAHVNNIKQFGMSSERGSRSNDHFNLLYLVLKQNIHTKVKPVHSVNESDEEEDSECETDSDDDEPAEQIIDSKKYRNLIETINLLIDQNINADFENTWISNEVIDQNYKETIDPREEGYVSNVRNVVHKKRALEYAIDNDLYDVSFILLYRQFKVKPSELKQFIQNRYKVLNIEEPKQFNYNISLELTIDKLKLLSQPKKKEILELIKIFQQQNMSKKNEIILIVAKYIL